VEGSARLPWRLGREGLEYLESADRAIRLDARTTRVERYLGLHAASAAVEIDGDRENLEAVLHFQDLALEEELPLTGETRIVLDSSGEGVVANIATPPGGVAHIRGGLSSDRVVDWMRPEEIEAALREARIHGSLDVRVDDLGHLQRLLPSVLHLEGRLEANLRVAGHWQSPKLDGEARIDEMSCTLKGDLPPLHGGSGRILFEGRTVRFEDFKGQLGYGPLAIGGTVQLPVDGVPVVDATIKGENVLLARSRNLRLRSNVDLKVSGPLDALLAKGKFVVTDALYSQPMDLFAGSAPAADHKLQLFSIREGPLSTLRLDVEIFGDRSFRISNNIVRGHFSPALRLRGTGAVPEPQGSIFFQDVLVKLELTSLKVDHGEVRFRPEDPFAPEIRVAAHTRLQGFDLDVALEGALPDVEVHVHANPPLPPRDAIILLMTGNTPERLEQKGAQGALMLAGTVFGKRLLSEMQGPSDPDEESFVDRFSVDMGRDISRSGEETIEAEFRVKKQWYARGERDRYDDYNFGVVWRIRFR
ncbi:MAG: translocation/assembly module TamB domain-containing protein, partial [Planctomycetota bacterium]|jgi:translocation and assembly module TamB